jgi:hypothetical protein
MDKRKYVALSLEEELRSSRPRFNNHNSNTTTTPSKPKPNTNNNNNNNSSAPKPTNMSPDQNVKEDPFKQVQGDELEDGDEDDEDDDGAKRPANAKRAGRRKIKIEYIQEKSRRHITFSKRKSGIMKKVLCFHLSQSVCMHCTFWETGSAGGYEEEEDKEEAKKGNGGDAIAWG